MTKNSENISTHDATTAEPSVLYARMRWLNGLRWIYVAMFAALTAGYYFVNLWSNAYLRLGDDGYVWSILSEMLRLAIVVAGYALVCNVTVWGAARRQAWHWLPSLLRIQLVADILGLVGVLYFTSNFERPDSPLAMLLLFHMAVAASLLERWEAFALSGIACVSYLAAPCWQLLSWPGREASGLTVTLIYYFSTSVNHWVYPFLVVGGLFGITYFVSALLGRLRRINQRLVEANRHLEGLDLAKSRFLRVSAHQIRSPLAAIHTMLSAVQEAGGLNHQQYEIVRKIQVRSEDAMTLVDEMMLLSTIREAAAEVHQLQAVQVDLVVQAEVAEFAAEAASRNVRLASDARSGAAIGAWEDALETVLEHLLSNAIKYTAGGGDVSVEARRDGADVIVTVSDSGIGIPADQRERLFHEFFRATNARQMAGGTGMGLAIVNAIVERLGGKISVESVEGQGTKVRVALPAAGAVCADKSRGEASGAAGGDCGCDKNELRVDCAVKTAGNAMAKTSS